jgi:hypothetical protein
LSGIPWRQGGIELSSVGVCRGIGGHRHCRAAAWMFMVCGVSNRADLRVSNFSGRDAGGGVTVFTIVLADPSPLLAALSGLSATAYLVLRQAVGAPREVVTANRPHVLTTRSAMNRDAPLGGVLRETRCSRTHATRTLPAASPSLFSAISLRRLGALIVEPRRPRGRRDRRGRGRHRTRPRRRAPEGSFRPGRSLSQSAGN